METMDDLKSVQLMDFSELLLEYPEADGDRQPEILGAIQNRMALPHSDDRARDIIKALLKDGWTSPSNDSKKLLADLLFEELEAVGYMTSATFEELYALALLLRRLSFKGSSGLFWGIRNNRLGDGMIERAFSNPYVAKQVEALKAAAKMPGSSVSDLLKFMRYLKPDPESKNYSHLERAMRLSEHYLKNEVFISNEAFLAMLEPHR